MQTQSHKLSLSLSLALAQHLVGIAGEGRGLADGARYDCRPDHHGVACISQDEPNTVPGNHLVISVVCSIVFPRHAAAVAVLQVTEHQSDARCVCQQQFIRENKQ